MHWVTDVIDHLEFSKSDKMKLQVAIEEAVVNIIHYAYPNQEGNLTIDLLSDSNQLKIKIRDHGICFNPLEKASSIPQYIPIEERDVGGLGISFMMNVVDHMEYQRIEDRNELCLIKYFQHDQ